jgi:LPS-assembly protein
MLLVNDPTTVRSTSHLWTLPRVTFSGRQALPKPTFGSGRLEEVFGPADVMWDSEYVYYWRERGLGTQRLDMHPQLKMPLRFTPYLETTATAGVDKTLYNIDNNTGGSTAYEHGLLTRTMYDYNLSTSTILMRDFAVHVDSYDQLTHMIRPQLSYDYVPVNPQESYPVFDAVDRIAAQNLLTFELLNDFDLFSVGGSKGTRKLAYLKLKQSYDIREVRKELESAGETRRPLSELTTEFEMTPIPDLRLHYESDLDVYGRGFTRYETRIDASLASFADLGLEYRYDKDLAISQLNADSHVAFTDKVSMKGGFLHSFVLDKTSEAYWGLLYEPECWAMEFLATTTAEEDFRFTLVFQLAGIGNVLGINQTLYATETQGLRFNKHRKYQ